MLAWFIMDFSNVSPQKCLWRICSHYLSWILLS